MAPVCKVAARRFRSMHNSVLILASELSSRQRFEDAKESLQVLYVKKYAILAFGHLWSIAVGPIRTASSAGWSGKATTAHTGHWESRQASAARPPASSMPYLARFASPRRMRSKCSASRLALHVKEKELAASCLTSGTQARESPRPVSTRISLGSRTQQ